jgi:fumarate hydratase class II
MPGKVNPVICESVMQVACEVVGNDAAITMGGFGGTGSLLQLNVAMPLMSYNLQESIRLLTSASSILAEKAIRGLEVNTETATDFVERSLMMCTTLAPLIGYEESARLAKEAFATGATIRELAHSKKVAHPDHINAALDARAMTGAVRTKSKATKTKKTKSGVKR